MVALFLDFDGTLAPIQQDPARCVLSGEARELLQRLADSGRHFVTVLSGRGFSDVKSKVGIRNICYGGNHGLVISGKGMAFVHPGALYARPVIDKAGRRLGKEIAGFAGAWVERKKFSLSLHYRLADKKDVSKIKKAFYRVATEFSGAGPLAVLEGKKVFELMPDISWDKGNAALWILDRLADGYLPVFVGDDVTDEAAFRALKERGVTVRVGRSKRTSARFYLKDYKETRRLLKSISLPPA
ncbi:MAG: trehalose-phosphatase [Nitrospiraceae bacterium]|nr:trehalose-phosphatase [Nitrospiraceae bacterium]